MGKKAMRARTIKKLPPTRNITDFTKAQLRREARPTKLKPPKQRFRSN